MKVVEYVHVEKQRQEKLKNSITGYGEFLLGFFWDITGSSCLWPSWSPSSGSLRINVNSLINTASLSVAHTATWETTIQETLSNFDFQNKTSLKTKELSCIHSFFAFKQKKNYTPTMQSRLIEKKKQVWGGGLAPVHVDDFLAGHGSFMATQLPAAAAASNPVWRLYLGINCSNKRLCWTSLRRISISADSMQFKAFSLGGVQWIIFSTSIRSNRGVSGRGKSSFFLTIYYYFFISILYFLFYV